MKFLLFKTLGKQIGIFAFQNFEQTFLEFVEKQHVGQHFLEFLEIQKIGAFFEFF